MSKFNDHNMVERFASDDYMRDIPPLVYMLKEYVQISPNVRMLNIGCGSGNKVPKAISQVVEKGTILSIDEAQNMIEHAEKEKLSYEDLNIKYRVANIFDIKSSDQFITDLKSDEHPYIMLFNVLPHLRPYDKLFGLLHDLLPNNGTIIIAHSTSRKYLNNLHASSSTKYDVLPPVD